MEEEKKHGWVVNQNEARQRTCDAIYKKYSKVIEAFNEHIIDCCKKCKRTIYYTTNDEIEAKDMHYFYANMGYLVEVEELETSIKGTDYKIKLCW